MESSSDDETDSLEFWNNWLPSSSHAIDKTDSCEKNIATKQSSKKFDGKTPRGLSFTDGQQLEFKNWIPPINFLKFEPKRHIVSKTSLRKIVLEGPTNEKLLKTFTESQVSEKTKNFGQTVGWRKEINLDWGERVQLNDVSKLTDGDSFWGLVNLGIFANIKLWVNEYNHVCGSADGKITKPNSSEMSYISVTNTELLRKMLNISCAQWASLCETVERTKTVLKFDAFENWDERTKTPLEKLWFFICRRRHFFPCQCILVKLSGAIKCLRKFQVIPKLSVLDIRNITGEPIL